MNIESYVLAQRHTFLILPAGSTPPAHINMTGAKYFRRQRLERGEPPRIAFDPDIVLDDLEKQGWAIVGGAVLTS